MEQFSYVIRIPAKQKAEAVAKHRALTTLGEQLTVEELAKLADVVVNNPIQKKIAKKFLGL